jgi:hypothetical protein
MHSCSGGDRRSARSAGRSNDGQSAPDRPGAADDCGFAPFSDDTSRSRETAFAKVRSRVSGTALAAKILGVA